MKPWTSWILAIDFFCMPQISWPLWKVLNGDKVDKHVITIFPRTQFLRTFNASFLREIHLSRLAGTDVIFRLPLQVSRAKIGQGGVLVSRIWWPFLESISVCPWCAGNFVLDLLLTNMIKVNISELSQVNKLSASFLTPILQRG